MNISLFLQMAADTDPDHIALVCDGRRWSYGALLRGDQVSGEYRERSALDAAAVAVPSAEWGEAVSVAVACQPGHAAPAEAALRALIKDRLRSSRVPERVVFVDALPYNEMGKSLRREVRKLFAD